MATWKASKFPGVRYREHPTRRHGLKADRYFVIRFTVAGRRYEEVTGWGSQGWTAKKAFLLLSELKANARTGKGPITLKESRGIAAKAKADAARDDLTFGQFFTSTCLSAGSKRESTLRTERALFRRWINPAIGDKPLSQIGVIDLERLKRDMTRAGRAPKTVSLGLGLIRHVFNEARRRGMYTGDNPISSVKMPKQDNRRSRFLSRSEADKLLKALAARSGQMHDIALLSLHTGMRAGEIFNLTWNDVDLGRGHLFIKDPKSGHNRYAYLTTATAEMLLERYVVGATGAHVFAARNGGRIRSVPNTFKRVVNELGFNEDIADPRQRVVFHTLRHTFASWLAEAGVDLFHISKLLGHQTIIMTQRYSHLGENSLRAAVARLEQANEAKVIAIEK